VKWLLARTNEAIQQATGGYPTEWRPPYGATNALMEDSTVLLHDGTGQNTPAALPMILDGLADRGYCTQ
jgi:peptidoglycan/xylan/chitin deacetylase (PgdA/CDA1 family)